MNVLEWINLQEQVRRFLCYLSNADLPEPDNIRFSDIHDDQVRLDWKHQGMPLIRVYVRSNGFAYWVERDHASPWQGVQQFDLSTSRLPEGLNKAIKKVKETK